MPNVDHVYGSQRYLKADDLPQGKQVRVVIERVVLERLKSNDGGEQDRLVLSFVGKKKALVLNATNARRIAEHTGQRESDSWPGWTISIYPTMVDFGKNRVPAIRVSDVPGSAFAPGPPPPPPPLPPAREPARRAEPVAQLASEEFSSDEDAPEVPQGQPPETDDTIPF